MTRFVSLLSTLLVLVLGLSGAGGVHAHKASDSFLYIADGSARLDLAVQDLQRLHKLDADGDGKVVWAELRAAEASLATVILGALELRQNQAFCAITIALTGISQHSDGAYGVWSLDSPCFAENRSGVSLNYRLLFDIDPLHRALYRMERGAELEVGVLSPASPSLLLGESSMWKTASDFFEQGVIHLVFGYDHMLFLLALLLPVVARLPQSARLPALLWQCGKIVTAFTLAHSLTLTAASLSWINLPSGPVELVIALSVSIAALLGLWSRYHLQWQLAAGFGLIHGFGFASMLAGLLSGGSYTVLALASFNIGIEVAQLAVMILLLPVLYLFRQANWYRRGLNPLAMSVIALIGIFWAWQRL